MKYISALIFTILFLLLFSLLVFSGKSKIFSVQEKGYLSQMKEIKKSYWEELPNLEKVIQTILENKRNQKVIEIVFKKNQSIGNNLHIGADRIKNLLILNQYKKILYIQNRRLFKNSFATTYQKMKLNKLSFSPSGDLAFFRSHARKYSKGFLVFEFDLATVLKNIFQKVGVDEQRGQYLYHHQSLIFDRGETPTRLNKVKNKIEQCDQTGSTLCQFFLAQDKKHLVLYRLSEDGVHAGFLYDSNLTGIPGISIVIFVIVFLIIILLFIIVFNQQRLKNNPVVHTITDLSSDQSFKNNPLKVKINKDITDLFEEINQTATKMKQEQNQKRKDSGERLKPDQNLASSDPLEERLDQYRILARIVLAQKNEFFDDRQNKIDLLRKSLHPHRIQQAFLLAKKKDHFAVVASLKIDLSQMANFKIYQHQMIFKEYLGRNQAMLIRNDQQQSQLIRACLPKALHQLDELFFLPLEKDKEILQIIVFR